MRSSFPIAWIKIHAGRPLVFGKHCDVSFCVSACASTWMIDDVFEGLCMAKNSICQCSSSVTCRNRLYQGLLSSQCRIFLLKESEIFMVDQKKNSSKSDWPMSSSLRSTGSFSRHSRTRSRPRRVSEALSKSSSSSSSSSLSTTASGSPERSTSPSSLSVAWWKEMTRHELFSSLLEKCRFMWK